MLDEKSTYKSVFRQVIKLSDKQVNSADKLTLIPIYNVIN